MRHSVPRRKACDHCAKAKRRCNGGQPCTTCTRKNKVCSLWTDSTSLRKISIPTLVLSTSSEACDVEQDSTTDSWSFLLESNSALDVYLNEERQKPTMNYILPPFTLVQLAPFRLHKCIQKLQDCISSIAQEASSLFLKFRSDGSDADTSTFFACTAYQSRTKRNQPILKRALSAEFLRLVRDLKRTISFRDHLSLLQSLIVFQIIFYFGDDDTLRVLAENHAESIQRSVWLFQQSLISEIVFPSIHTSVDDTISVQYQRWLLLESARRMILAHLFVKGIYSHLRNGYCDIVPALAELPLSIEGDLWEADTEDMWKKFLTQKPRILESSVMPYGEAVTFWLVNDCPNMDDFHHLIYEACHDLEPASI